MIGPCTCGRRRFQLLLGPRLALLLQRIPIPAGQLCRRVVGGLQELQQRGIRVDGGAHRFIGQHEFAHLLEIVRGAGFDGVTAVPPRLRIRIGVERGLAEAHARPEAGTRYLVGVRLHHHPVGAIWRTAGVHCRISVLPAHQVFFDVLPVFGSLRVTGLDTDDTFVVRAMLDNPEYIEVFVNGQREYAGLKESLTGGIQFDGLAGNDTLVVDYEVGGDPVPSGGIFFQGNIPEGGDGVGDSLDILAGSRSVDFQNEQSDLDAGLFVVGDSGCDQF